MYKLANNLWQVMNTASDNKRLRVLQAGSVLVMLFLFVLGGFNISTVPVDSDTYIHAGERFFAGDIDQARTPVYPVICHLALCLGNAGMYLIALLQAVVFILSIKWLYKTAQMIFTEHNVVTFIVVALYAWNIAVVHYVLMIMTESLSLSCVVLLFMLIVKGIKEKFTIKDALIMTSLYVVMLFLRPFFICFAPLLVLYFIFARKNFNRGAIATFWAGLAIVGACYVGYCAAFNARYGVFTTSSVPDINLNAQLYEAGLLESPIWEADTVVMVRDHALNREVLMANRKAWFVHMCEESLLSARQLYPKIVLSHGGMMCQPLSLQISAGMLYLITLAFAIVTFVRWRRFKADVRIETLMLLSIIVTVVTSVWGAFGIYTRLMLPCYTALCIVLGYFFARFKV